jgi:hypothetical protein
VFLALVDDERPAAMFAVPELIGRHGCGTCCVNWMMAAMLSSTAVLTSLFGSASESATETTMCCTASAAACDVTLGRFVVSSCRMSFAVGKNETVGCQSPLLSF